MTVTPEQIALVNRNLPSSAKVAAPEGYGWTNEFIETLMETTEFDSPAKAVRHFWMERVNETAEYLDMGKPLTQIHEQARAMLAYWDTILGINPNEMVPVPTAKRPMTFGEIARPWNEG